MTRTDDSPIPDYPSLLRLDGRRIVVVGAGNGIGRQASHALAMVGARLCCVDVDAELAVADRGRGGRRRRGRATCAGVPTRRGCSRRRSTRSGGSTAWSASSARRTGHRSSTSTDDDWDAQHDLLLRYAFMATQLGARAIGDGPGSMVFVASLSGYFAVAQPRRVRRVQGRADVARALGRPGARAERAGQRRRPRRGAHAAVGPPRGRPGAHRGDPVAQAGRAVRHRRVDPVPHVRPGRPHHRADDRRSTGGPGCARRSPSRT